MFFIIINLWYVIYRKKIKVISIYVFSFVRFLIYYEFFINMFEFYFDIIIYGKYILFGRLFF